MEKFGWSVGFKAQVACSVPHAVAGLAVLVHEFLVPRHAGHRLGYGGTEIGEVLGEIFLAEQAGGRMV
jgi:hypothetical protein